MRKLHRNGLITALVGGAAATALVLGTSGTGASFTDSGTGHVKVTTGSVTQTLSDADHTGTFDLNFLNLGSNGTAVSDSLSIKNDGSKAMKTEIGQPLANVNTGGVSAADASKLKVMVKVNGATVQDWTAVTALPGNTIDLGSIPVNATRTVVVSVKLENAGNEWKGKTVEGDVTVTSTEA